MMGPRMRTPVFSLVLAVALPWLTFAKDPNIVFILADDVNYDAIGCYGGTNVATPNIDRLASEGIQFNQAYSAMAMCAPFRAELYTGLYPVRNGVASNHTSVRPGTKSVCHYLGDLGYRVFLTGKKHASPAESFPFESPSGNKKVRGIDWQGIERLMTEEEDPFCLFVCSSNAHAAWTEGDASQFDPDTIRLLPTQHDNPETREIMRHYYAEVGALDDQVGRVMQIVEDSGKTDDTLLVFSSEQGWALGFAKWSNWNMGVHTALVARWPGHIEPGRTTDDLVQMADVVPTFIDVAGGRSERYGLDGGSFLPLLKGIGKGKREFVYGVHNNIPEGEPYPIRSIHDGEYHYLWNLKPEASYHEKHVMVENSRLVWWQAKQEAVEAGDRRAAELAKKYTQRPAEELYRASDIYEVENLAGNPEYASVKRKLRRELEAWMASQRDPGAYLDTEEGRDELKRTPFPGK